MQEAKMEFEISNSYIWMVAFIPPASILQVHNYVKFSEFDAISWLIFLVYLGIIPLIACIYRSKVLISNDNAVIHRGILGEKWLTRKTISGIESITLPEDDENRHLVIKLKNGKEYTFTPKTNFKNMFIRHKVKKQ